MIEELETRYQQALRPVFGEQFRILHDSDDLVTVVLDGDAEDFFFTLYGSDHVRLYWCNECFIFDKGRNDLVSSDTYGEIVYEGDIETETLPDMIVGLVLRLKDRTFAGKEETIKGKIPSGYDDVKDYVVLAATDDPAEAPYRLGNILIRYCLRR